MRILLSLIAMNSLLACGQRQAENRQPPCSTTEDCRAFGAEFTNHVCSIENRCVVDRCGDGIVQAGEQCDDGNALDTDACTATCKNAVCSDGFTHSGVEECDDADLDNTNGCTNHCALPSCGDGFAQPGEECDDGNQLAADDCTNQCFHASCGDGVRRRFTLAEESPRELLPEDEGYEACDDGNLVDIDACTSACRLAACGDGFVYGGNEECDDANDISGDGCSQDCNSEVCGNGRIDAGESCDDANRVDSDDCTNACAPAGCGDGVTSEREECDDGNLVGGDDCSSTCLVESCGNGRVDPEAGEQCDDGNADNTDVCTAECLRAVCGDGNQHLGIEECDDGNLDLTDSCVSNCRLARCGDAQIQAGIESCDDGNLSNTDACLGDCREASCGDGFLRQGIAPGEPGYEACDDGNLIDSDNCTSVCQPARCGDSIIQLGEECDDGNNLSTDDCTATCRLASCGDGFVQGGRGEACDDANLDNADACTTACQSGRCGDGHLRVGLDQGAEGYEACDDGNQNNTDSCVGVCQTARCGDSFIHIGFEACDDGNDVDEDSCTVACNAANCGDGFVQPGNGEECDDGNLLNIDACSARCQTAVCGDGIRRRDLAPGVQGYEACDDGNSNNTDACVGSCARPTCGDGYVQNGVEQCDDGNDVQTDDCTNLCVVARCGDGHVQAGNGEACDDANDVDADVCTNACLAAVCGDAIRRRDLSEGDAGFETCDDGNGDNSDACTVDCKDSSCGDGYHQPANGEECDDGNSDEADSCLSNCESASCGDGEERAGVEACDDGNDINTDVCTNFCADARCGDRFVRHDLLDLADSQFEECDDGNLDDDDGCTSACRRPVKDVAMGDGHTCAIRHDDKVVCFGTNTFSQSGYESVKIGWPVQPAVVREEMFGQTASMTDSVTIAAGDYNTCVIKRTGAVSCWGGGNTNQPGLGRVDDSRQRAEAKEIIGFAGIAKLAIGYGHTCAVNNAGAVWCWGRNSTDQLGDGDSVNSLCNGENRLEPKIGNYQAVPRRMRSLDFLENGQDVPSISANGGNTCVVIEGNVWCWGRYTALRGANVGDNVEAGIYRSRVELSCPSVIDGITGAIEVAAASSSACALINDGSIQCWGLNYSGELGRGDDVTSLRSPGAVANIDDAIHIVAGGSHYCALLADRSISCWGNNSWGQLGDGTRVNRNVPTTVSGIENVRVLRSNSKHVCAINNAGRMRCWGKATSGQLGDGRTSQTKDVHLVNRTSGATNLSGGDDHLCATVSNRSVRCWGGNSSGQLGDGSSSASSIPLSVTGVFLGNYQGTPVLGVDSSTSCSSTRLGDSDDMSCWGASSALPGDDNDLAEASKLSFGSGFGCMIVNETIDNVAGNRVKCWGSNSYNKLGRAGLASTTPTLITSNLFGIDVSAHYNTACAVLGAAADATVGGAYCWGQNGNDGLHGNGVRNDSLPYPTAPVAVEGVTGVSQISVGSSTVCAVQPGGNVKCWGNGSNSSPLGGGPNTPTLLPATVVQRQGNSYPALGGITQVDSGQQHMCARSEGGHAYCWGNSAYGVLGLRNYASGDSSQRVQRTVDSRLVDLQNVVSVAVGVWYSCALLADGAGIVCWGADNHGQLGQESAPPFYDEPQNIMPLYDGRNYARSISTDSETYNQGDDVVVRGFGFDPFATAVTEIKRAGDNYQIVDTLQVAREGRVRSPFLLEDNLQPGAYEIRVREIGGSSSEPININVVVAPNSVNTLPFEREEEINPAGEVDWYRLTAAQNQSVRLQTSGNTDTFCEVYVDGRRVAQNDDSGEGYNCRIDQEIILGTTYMFKVRHFSPTGVGDYVVSLSAQ